MSENNCGGGEGKGWKYREAWRVIKFQDLLRLIFYSVYFGRTTCLG